MLENREVYPFTTEEEWLATRAKDYTSTTVSALFGLSPYLTEFEVYHARKSGLRLPFKGNSRMAKGKRLEWAIAEEVGLMLGCEVVQFKDYVRIP
jgi:predicted phage-related endonuclease